MVESDRTRRNCSSRPTRRLTRTKAKRIEAAGIERVAHPLGAHLRKQARRLRQLLRPQPGHRRHGQTRRSRRHHRRAIHRRAGHAVDHADVPHRRHGRPGVQEPANQGQVRRHGPLQRTAPRRAGGRQQHRPEQERLRRPSSPTTAANWNSTTSSSARSFPSRTAARSRRARPSCSGTPTTCRSFPKRPAR